jgi:hypothetical protein
MSDKSPNENKTPENEIGDELRELGNNLRDALRSAWESDEARKLQKDIEDGLASLGTSLSEAAKDFSNSQTGQNLKEDVKDLRQRWESGEVGSKVRYEVLDALRTVNDELKKTVSKNPPSPPKNPQE